MVFHVAYPRTMAERRPPGHQPAAPRFTLRWHQPVSMLVSQYHAMQHPDPSSAQQLDFLRMVEDSFLEADGPVAHERMRFADAAGDTNVVVASYWLDATSHARWTGRSRLSAWFRAPERLAEAAGYWREAICVPYDRHETIYSAPNYRIGLARMPGTSIESMTSNGYFGAARDRLPVSAIDPLESPLRADPPLGRHVESRGRRLIAVTPHNMTALRSGQYWEPAEGEQRDDYLENLQPKLRRGMDYLSANAAGSGTLSLRIMTNMAEDGSDRAETSVLAYFLSLDQLEDWAKSHTTHLEIYDHAIAMNRKFREKRQVVTWHELFVMPTSAGFEYVNCNPGTGLIPYAELMELHDPR